MSANGIKKASDVFAAQYNKDNRIEIENEAFLANLANTMYDIRKHAGLTQKQAAGLSGFSQAMVSKMESGEYNPSALKMWRYARNLGASINVDPYYRTEPEVQIEVQIEVQRREVTGRLESVRTVAKRLLLLDDTRLDGSNNGWVKVIA